MENLLANLEDSNHATCAVPCCEEPRASARLHRGSRACVRHLVLALEGEKAVLLDKLASSEACLRSAEQANREMRVKLRELSGVVERDAFVAALVRERDDAVRARDGLKREMDAQMQALETKIARNLL